MDTIRKQHKLIDLFCELVTIPSPSLKEEKVIDKDNTQDIADE